MAIWRVNNSTALGGEVCAPWTTGHAYTLGARVVCRIAYGTTARRAYVYECTTAGTSHGSTEPTWPTSGTVNDNDVVWTCRSPNDGTWDNASCYLNYVLNYASADNDTILISHAHNESSTTPSALAGGSAITAPKKIYSVNKSTDALTAGAKVNYSGGATYGASMSGWAHSYGVEYGATAANPWIFTTTTKWILESDCAHNVLNHGVSGGTFTLSGCLEIVNGDINFAYSNCVLSGGAGGFIWRGGKVVAPSGLTALLSWATYLALIENVDLSAMGSGGAILQGNSFAATENCRIILSRCKLPASYAVHSGSLYSALNQRTNNLIKFNCCSAGSSHNEFYEKNIFGSATLELTIVRTGGASDTAGHSIELVSTASNADGIFSYISPPIFGWTDSTTEKTFTIELVHDSATALQNDEIWMELEYFGSSSSPLGSISSSRCAPLGTPADITDSSETWTTTGLTNPNTRKLSVTVTPGKAGPITARIYLAKSSTTVYIDPMIVES